MITMIAMEYTIPRAAEKRLLAKLAARADPEARRMERFLALPDLSRQPTGPLSALVRQVSAMSQFKNFFLIQISEIVPVDVSFDLFNFAPNHPARSRSDTYYVDEKNILRTHDTVMWYYYLNQPAVQKKIANQEALGVLCYGKVYRKDEIDRRHMNVFHQMGGLYLVRRLICDSIPILFPTLIPVWRWKLRPMTSGSRFWAAGCRGRKCWLISAFGITTAGLSVLVWNGWRF